MSIRTIKSVAVTAGANIVGFEEGPLSTTDFEVVGGLFVDSDGYKTPMGPDDYSLKTVNGFTVTVAAAGTFSAAAFEYGTASPASSIITLSEIKQRLGMADATTTWDTFLTYLIGIVSGWIEEETNSVVAATVFDGTDAIIVNGNGKSKLYMPNGKMPIIELANGAEADIQYKDQPADAAWTDLITDADNVVIDPENPTCIDLYYDGTVFPVGRQNIRLCLKLGYNTIPSKIRNVCVEKVMELFDESKQELAAGRLGVQSKSSSGTLENKTTTYYQLSDRHKEELKPFSYARI
jgi:hypothetical protein